jgi:putative ABC transport system permease protein
MTWLRVMALRFLAIFKRRRLDAELDDELKSHLEMLVQECLRKGMPPAEARYEALRCLGGLEQLKESYRDQRGLPLLETVIQDLRFAARILKRDPGVTLIAVVILALGIGATTSIFSVVDAVLLHPLPYGDPARLVVIWEKSSRDNDPRYPLAPANFEDLRRQSSSFEQMAAYLSFTVEQIIAGNEQADRVRTAYVSPRLFGVLGTSAVAGRVFLPEEDQLAHSDVALLSHGFWQRRFGGDPNLQGLTVVLDDRPYQVVGVLPQQFRFPAKEVEIWLPLTYGGTVFPQNQATTRSVHYLGAVARLKAGVSLEAARAELDGIAGALERAYPDSNKGIGVTTITLLEETVGKVRPALLVLMTGVGFVLLIACANVANLMLARATSREREVAVRAALGARRSRIMRQLLTESCLVALLGCVLGLLLARCGIGLLMALGPADLPRLEEVGLNRTVLVFAAVLSALTGIFFGLAPARRLSNVGSGAILACGGRDPSGAPGHPRLRRALVVLEIALSLVLLVGAGLMIRSFAGLMSVDPGFDPGNLLTLEIMLPPNRYADARQRTSFYRLLFDKLKGLPGVRYAGGATRLPMSAMVRTSNPTSAMTIEGQSVPEAQKPSVDFRRASGDYFRAMGIPLLAGREFDERDDGNAAPVVLINEKTARLYFSGMQPLGRHIQLGPSAASTWYTIVGIVGNVRHLGLESTPRPEVYTHTLQSPPIAPFIAIRTVGDPSGLLTLVRSEVRKLDRGIPVFSAATMEELVAESLADRKFNMLLLGTFAVVALALAAVGIYGVVACSVSQRTHEFGIRLALGAQPRDVVGMVVREVAEVAVAGMSLGLAGALALTRLVKALLYGVGAQDPLTILAAGFVLVFSAVLASFIPARRATKVDPVLALRSE